MKYIYKVTDVELFKNNILINKIDVNFSNFCLEQGITPINFCDHPNQYILTTKKLTDTVYDMDSKGKFFKYLLNIKDIEMYNKKVVGSIIYYTEIDTDTTDKIEEKYLEILKENNDEIFNFHGIHGIEYSNRNKLLCLNDYIIYTGDSANLSPVNLKEMKADIDSKTLSDFNMFYKMNVLPCKKCNRLVANAFAETGIQNEYHEGCKNV